MAQPPGGRPSPAGAVPSSTFGTPWKMRRLGPPNTSRSPLRSSTSVNGDVRRSTPAMPEHARVAEADRHDRRVGRLLPVLVQAEASARGVEVDDRRVRARSTSPAAVARGVGDRPPARAPPHRRASASPAHRRCRRPCVSRRTGTSASRGTPTAPSSRGRPAPAGGAARPAARPTDGTRAPVPAARRSRASGRRARHPEASSRRTLGRSSPVSPERRADRARPSSAGPGGNVVGTPPSRLRPERPRAPSRASSFMTCSTLERRVV